MEFNIPPVVIEETDWLIHADFPVLGNWFLVAVA